MQKNFQMSISTKYLIDFPIASGVSITDTGKPGCPTYDTDSINRRANAVASGLAKLNFPYNSRIVIIDYVSFDFVTTNTGVYRARHAIVPINFKVPAQQIEYCIRDSGAVMAFCHKDFVDLIPSDLRCIVFDSKEFDEFLGEETFECPEPDPDYAKFDDRDITVLYTSGTTGKPKGVINNYQNRFYQISRGLTTPSVKWKKLVAITAAPLYHLAGLNNVEQDLFFSPFEETHIILMPQFDTKKYIEYTQKYSVTRLRLVAPMMGMILQEQQLLETADFSSVTGIALTSSFAPRKMQEDVRKYFKNLRWLENPYGLTETGPLFGSENPRNLPKPIGSAGYPLPGVECRINAEGVLEAKGPAIMKGYHNRPDLSNSMTPDGYFITGDLFRVNYNGFYFYMGRADDMFKSGGEKIYPSEIEPIIERHPAVALSTVVGVEDEVKGHKPYAFVELKPNITANSEDIKQFTIENVATYQIPRRIWILDTLPRTNIGKIDRKALKEMAIKLLEENK